MKNPLKNIKYKKTTRIICVIILFYCFLIVSANYIQTTSTFPATVYNVQDFVWHIDYELDFEEINIQNKDWLNINGLYADAKSDKTVYYFHGNGWPLSYFFTEIKYINSLWYNVIAYDYPGYWKSEWKPNKNIVDNFSQTFYNYVKNKYKINNEELIVWWYSIWTAVATDFASKNEFEKLVLVSPLSSRYDMSRKLFWFAIQKILFLHDSYVSKELVKNFSAPVLIIHWNDDMIVPYEQWKTVFQNYWNNLNNKNKSFITIDKTGHNYIIDDYGEILKYTISDFLKNDKLNFEELFLDNKKIEQIKKDNQILSLDFETDNSITKFVNNIVSFTSLDYIPEKLEKIESEYVFDTKWYWELRSEANKKLQNLAKDFFEEFNIKLKVVSSYRSYKYQKWIKDRWCPDNLCAKAWYSEHQSWLAVDIFAATTQKDWLNNSDYTAYYNWFVTNAHKYGFHNTYQRWLEIDWYEIEPWHWRYMWTNFAKYLLENDMTVAEYYGSL